jgi:hypothetical protein
VRVRELELDGEGARGRVHLALDRVDAPLLVVNGAVGQDQRDLGLRGPFAPLLRPLRDPQILGLADSGAEQDRVDRRDGREQRALAAADEVAGPHLRRADDPVQRRRDRGVTQVELGLVESRLRGVELGERRVARGDGVVVVAPAHGLLLGEGLQAGFLDLGLPDAGFHRRDLRLRVGDRRLEGLGVDLVERRALRDERPLGELHRLEVALDARADLDVLRALRLAHDLEQDGHVLRDDRGDVDLGHGGLGGFLLRAGGWQERRDDSKRGPDPVQARGENTRHGFLHRRGDCCAHPRNFPARRQNLSIKDLARI